MLEKCTELCYKYIENIKNNVTMGIYLEKTAN